MSGQATIESRTNHVLVHLEGGPLSPREITATMTRAVGEANESHPDILIVRENCVKHSASILNFYQYAEWLIRSGFRGKLALAFPEEMHDDQLDFFLTAARNRYVNVKLFANESDAVRWLENDREKGV